MRGCYRQACLLLWEWLTAYKYDEIGYCIAKLGQLPHVIITHSPRVN